ncbi:MAG: hypothetical protein K6F10_04955 [Paludibacteraceae bacterium]|nr:hypothetical protein [Paludibacteraceae bacterium]
MRKIFLFVAAVVCAASMNAQEPLPGEELVFDIHADITITAFFTPFGGELGVDDVNAEVRVRKSLLNGQLLIEKNGKIFNAQGAQIQ